MLSLASLKSSRRWKNQKIQVKIWELFHFDEIKNIKHYFPDDDPEIVRNPRTAAPKLPLDPPPTYIEVVEVDASPPAYESSQNLRFAWHQKFQTLIKYFLLWLLKNKKVFEFLFPQKNLQASFCYHYFDNKNFRSIGEFHSFSHSFNK